MIASPWMWWMLAAFALLELVLVALLYVGTLIDGGADEPINRRGE